MQGFKVTMSHRLYITMSQRLYMLYIKKWLGRTFNMSSLAIFSLERKLLNLNKSLLNGIIDQQDYDEQKAN